MKSTLPHSSPVELAVQVLEAKDVPGMSTGEVGSGALVVTASLFGGARETLPSSLRAGATGHMLWAKGNVLSWRLEAAQLAQLKATAPKVRLTICVRARDAAPGSAGTYVGYALLSLRDAEMSLSSNHGPWQGWLTLEGGKKAGGGGLHVIAGMLRVPDLGGGGVKMPTIRRGLRLRRRWRIKT